MEKKKKEVVHWKEMKKTSHFTKGGICLHIFVPTSWEEDKV